ncbi:GIY-YIG nuclease family protein [Streptomyces sp. NPDC048383]|uniref:GIY-YIG nuclease family protein n=1 Tax=Streptomyces sp. NPDC048383 TaxID=3155386 RepID=UPI003425D2A7
MHRLLAGHRVSANREFFRVSPDVAKRAIHHCQQVVTGIGTWGSLPAVHRLRAGDRVALPFLDREGTAHNRLLMGRERLVAGDRLVWLSDREGPDNCRSVVFEAKGFCQVTYTRHALSLLSTTTDAASPLNGHGQH